MVVICVDGPVAAGKGTLAKSLANRFHFAYLDTGALYRAVGRRVLREGGDPRNADAAARAAAALTESDRTDPHLRDEATGEAASIVAAMPAVRAALLAFQRSFAAHPPSGEAGSVLDGRDIGTVVCPDAHLKLFITASAEQRAHRRWLEIAARGEDADEARVLADLRQRDARDSQRDSAPLKPADDAIVVDTTTLDADAALRVAVEHAERVLAL